MRQQQLTKPARTRVSWTYDLRTPSGRHLPF